MNVERRLPLAASAGAILSLTALAHAEPIADAPARSGALPIEAPLGADVPPSSPFCTECLLVGAGAVLVIGAIPLFVQAELTTTRSAGVDAALGAIDCEALPDACSTLRAADVDAARFWVAAGVLGGAGVALIAIGGALAFSAPGAGRVAWSIAPTAGGAATTLRVRF